MREELDNAGNRQMKTLQNPNTIEVLIHCHCSPEPHPRAHAPAVFDTIAALQEHKLIVPFGTDGWKTTPLGEAWVKALCRVPMPRLVYVDADGTLLSEPIA